MTRSKVKLLPVVLAAAAGCYSPPAGRSLAGRTEAGVIAEFGKPSREWPGHFGLPPLTWTQKFKGEVKSATFRKPGGDIYMSFEKRDDIWYVIDNAWLPEGAAF